MATIVPGSDIHHHLSCLASPKSARHFEDERFAYRLTKCVDRAARRNQVHTYQRATRNGLANRAGLVESLFRLDTDFVDIRITHLLTPLGREALASLTNGYVWDGKNKQTSFALTSRWYEEELSRSVISDQLMQQASRLPDRYKAVHKRVLLCQLFYEKDVKGQWTMVL